MLWKCCTQYASKFGKRRGWDGWMASPTQWIWVWVNFGSLLKEGWTGKPGVLQSTGSQGVGHDWATKLNWMHRKISPGSAQWPLQDTLSETVTRWIRLTCYLWYKARYHHLLRGLEAQKQTLTSLTFPFKDFFDVGHFKSLYWICYSIASVLCFGFFAPRHVWS